METWSMLGVETHGKWAITLFLGVIGLCLTTAISWYWERRSRTPRCKYMVGVHKDMTIGPDPSAYRSLCKWTLTITNLGQVPITVGALTLRLAKKKGGEIGTSLQGPSHGSDVTILPSTKATFHPLEVNLTKSPWNEAAALFESGGKTPYFRTSVINELTTLEITTRQMESILQQPA